MLIIIVTYYAYDGHIMDSARVTVILGILIIIVTYYAYDGHLCV